MTCVTKWARRLLLLLLTGALAGSVVISVIYLYLEPNLPSVASLSDVRFQVPLRVYTRDGALLAEFGEKRRHPVALEDVPARMLQAFIAAEDDRFYQHPGVDYQGLLRAVVTLAKTGRKSQGGSTITMQVARNFFLSSEKTYLRKVNEIFLALKIERELTKNQILALYLNKIYLGNRAYGVGAASRVYYGVAPSELTLAQIATIAGLPKAPSRDNPLARPEASVDRRTYVLRRMYDLGAITIDEFEQARHAPVTARRYSATLDLEASYVAELVRKWMLERYGNETYSAGYRVYTTIEKRLQEAANQAVQQGVLAYEYRHGYRGVEVRIELPEPADVDSELAPEVLDALLQAYSSVGPLHPALVLGTDDQTARVYIKKAGAAIINWDGLAWARVYESVDRLGPPVETAAEIVQAGDVVWVEQRSSPDWHLSQLPQVEGALVALRPEDGSVSALVGGFDYYHSKFNRIYQARRQPGSGFKPFVYSTALSKGYTAASLINDAPIVFADSSLENTWRPENYSGKFYGPTRLRVALMKSRNLVSIRLLKKIGVKSVLDYAEGFGFDAASLPRNLSLALGSGTVAPIELARGYAALANGGFRIDPHFIDRVEDSRGEVIYQAQPKLGCVLCEQAMARQAEPEEPAPTQVESDEVPNDDEDEMLSIERLAPRAMTHENNFIMNSLLQDVVKRGTGRRALQLGRKDLAGKTGTTNDQRDAWFSGYQSTQVAIAWLGFDQTAPLGERETGGKAALPMWMTYMREALKDVPHYEADRPPGLVSVRIDPETGLRVSGEFSDALFEIFRREQVPEYLGAGPGGNGPHTRPADEGSVEEELF
ncbi:MAG TPA: penicillin-binding protein 1A [Chromatiaceae bacterium]|jgi:penicillin-binding protein 1A|nr:penicillin-binding protein 1A [Chromatiaceae bacterium]HIN82906.1 penicillin-binding protein 1A [Chromatiales bacterium]